MDTQRSLAMQTESKNDRQYFSGIREDVDLDDEDDGLTEQRLAQWRPFSQSPFTNPDLGLMTPNNRPQTEVVDDDEDEKALDNLKPEINRANTSSTQQSLVPKLAKVMHSPPTWVNLFYDLAWTATFSTLTQNGKFDDTWDTVSYVTFFVMMWWLWVSQTLYSTRFYTNDWVHLLSIFLQLIIFGLLAASTRGYNVAAYISKWATEFDPKTIDKMFDPERYREDRVASHSFNMIAFSIAASRTVHWFQHVFVFYHAYRTSQNLKLRIPLKLRILPVGLALSVGLFWTAAVITLLKGRTYFGAIFKFALWSAGLIVELSLHSYMESLSWKRTKFRNTKETDISHNIAPQTELPGRLDRSPTSHVMHNQGWPVPQSNVNIRERLEGITTVILGEGLNGIAGTLYSVISAPGLGGPVAANIACAAIIVYLLAYFYFEGPTGHRDLKRKSVRKMSWMMLHLPFLLGIILLLLAVKNQFILTSYLSTSLKTFKQYGEIMDNQRIALDDPASATNIPMKNFLLKRGVTWADEFKRLNATVTRNGTVPLVEVSNEEYDGIVGVWNMRVSLKIMKEFYMVFMGENAKIGPEIEKKIQEYYTNDSLPLHDWTVAPELVSSYHYESIITELLKTHLEGARYIVALAAAILISLGILNRIHSKPRDRYQWGIIISRICMGIALLFLLFLNLGDIQSLWVWEDQKHDQAGVFLWIWAWMVLPTLAIALAVEFFIELILLRCAGLAIARKRGRVSESLWRAFFRKPLSWSRQARPT